MTFALGRLGASYGKLGAGCSSASSTPGFSLDAPVAQWISDPTVSQATFDLDVDINVVAGMKVRGEAATANTFGGAIFDTKTEAIGAPDLVDFEITTFKFRAFSNIEVFARFCVLNSSDVQISDWSNTISETLASTAGSYFGQRYFGRNYFGKGYFG